MNGVSIIVGDNLFEAFARAHNIATANNCRSPADSAEVSIFLSFLSYSKSAKSLISILTFSRNSSFLIKKLKHSLIEKDVHFLPHISSYRKNQGYDTIPLNSGFRKAGPFILDKIPEIFL